jgi:NTE family protein
MRFRNLVLCGGGVRTFVFHGALAALEERGVLAGIDRVAGTSAGAFLAAAIAFRTPVTEALAPYRTMDLERVAQKQEAELNLPAWTEKVGSMRDGVASVAANAEAMRRLRRSFGLYSMDYGYRLAQDLVASACDGDTTATFAEFRRRGFRDLFITAVNLSALDLVVFSHETTPDVAVADAVTMSQALPFFFQAIRFDGRSINPDEGDYYVDGGVFNNYPITVFDDPAYVDDPEMFVHGINRQTIGLHLYEPAGDSRDDRPIDGLRSYVEHLYRAWTRMQDVQIRSTPSLLNRTIRISNMGVGSLDLTVQPVPDNDTYREMCDEGHRATLEWLDDQAGGLVPVHDDDSSFEDAGGPTASLLRRWIGRAG